jgi:hypothetical protein
LILAGVGAVVLALFVVGLVLVTSGPADDVVENGQTGGTTEESEPRGESESTRVVSAEAVRAAVEKALPSIACSWLDIDVRQNGDGVRLEVSGVAQDDTLPAINQQLAKVAGDASPGVVTDTSDIFPVGPSRCPALDALRPFRQPTSERGRSLSVAQSSFEIVRETGATCGDVAAARPVISIDVPDGQEFALIGLDQSGGALKLTADRAAFDVMSKELPDNFTMVGTERRMTACINQVGLVGQLILTGRPPFDVGIVDARMTDGRPPTPTRLDENWATRFTSLARERGWRTEMAWFRVVDDVSE